MFDEIREEPEAIRKTLNKNMDSIQPLINEIKESSFIFITGSGTSYNAAVMLNYTLLENGIRSMAITSSEYSENIIRKLKGKVLNIIFSQSGESSDAISNLELSKENGFKVVGITNEKDSYLSRESDLCVLTYAGEERSVAATKSHAVQISISLLIDFCLKENPGLEKKVDDICGGIGQIIKNSGEVQKYAGKILQKIVFLGAGKCYPVALEGGLKFKETSGVSTESYPTREYFHGPVHRLDRETTVIWITDGTVPDMKIMEKLSASAGNTITIGNGNADLKVASSDGFQKALNSLVHMQLLANFKATGMGLDPDHPSNLSKVVRW